MFTTITFFSLRGLSHQWWAFKQMRLALPVLRKVPGLTFCKLMGSGGGNGFSLKPDFSTYCLIGVWDGKTAFDLFFEAHPLMQQYKERSQEHYTVFLKCYHSRGKWNGRSPFEGQEGKAGSSRTAVLTRGSVKFRWLLRFWKQVPAVSGELYRHKDLLFARGVGEWPLIELTTFSLWKNEEQVNTFAYHSKSHVKAIQRTRETGWFREELFARFEPVGTLGSWEGKDPLAVPADPGSGPVA